MLSEIINMLKATNYKDCGPCARIAKGKYKTPGSTKEIINHCARILKHGNN